MLSVDHLSDPAALRQAFDRFRFWGHIRGVAQVLAFFAATWALVAVIGSHTGGPASTTH